MKGLMNWLLDVKFKLGLVYRGCFWYMHIGNRREALKMAGRDALHLPESMLSFVMPTIGYIGSLIVWMLICAMLLVSHLIIAPIMAALGFVPMRCVEVREQSSKEDVADFAQRANGD